MPGLNQEGPDGVGAMTGRQRGICRRAENQTFTGEGSGLGRGLGLRRGLGQGRGQGRGQGLGQGLGQGRRFEAGVESSQNNKVGLSEELRILKDQYLAGQEMISKLEQKITVLESKK